MVCDRCGNKGIGRLLITKMVCFDCFAIYDKKRAEYQKELIDWTLNFLTPVQESPVEDIQEESSDFEITEVQKVEPIKETPHFESLPDGSDFIG